MKAIKLFLFAVLCSTLFACAGLKARNTVLLPALQATWPHMQDEAVAGGANQSDVATFEAALKAGSLATIAEQWPSLKADVAQGISTAVKDNKLSQAAAGSEQERLKQFDAAIQKLLSNGILTH